MQAMLPKIAPPKKINNLFQLEEIYYLYNNLKKLQPMQNYKDNEMEKRLNIK